MEIPQLAQLNLKVETLKKQPCDLNSIYLEPITGSTYSHQKTLVLVAPESWPGEKSAKTVPFSVKVSAGSNTTDNSPGKNLELRKTPVVLVHGVWADASSFGGYLGMADQLRANGFYVAPLQSYDNWRGPSEVVPRSGNGFYVKFILPALNEYKRVGIVCNKVDIVGHSMGGLMAKKFLLSDNFIDRYFGIKDEGIVRRIVTLGTPHLGSPLASVITGDYDYLPMKGTPGSVLYGTATFKVTGLLAIADLATPTPFLGSALHDLKINSLETRHINSGFTGQVPIFSIAGNTGRQSIGTDAVWGIMGGIVGPALLGVPHDLLFCDIPKLLKNPADEKNYTPEDSDTVVGISSALWKLPAANTRTLSGIQHTGMGQNSQLAQEVISLLNGPVSSFYKAAGGVSANAYSEQATVREYNSFSGHSLHSFAAKDVAEIRETIVLTVSQSTALPGGSLTFDATLTENADLETTLLINGVDAWEMTKTGDTYKASITIPEDYSGVKRYIVGGFAGENIFRSNVVEVVVKPNLSNLSQLIVPGGPHFTFSAGFDFQLTIEGEFANGRTFDITSSKLGTTYQSDNPLVATVTEDGVVKAVSPGKTLIVVTNGDESAMVYLDIVPFEVQPGSVVEKSTLAAKIAEAKELLSTLVVGDQAGQYPQWAYNLLESAIDNAEAIYGDDSASFDMIAGAVENLQNAIDTINPSHESSNTSGGKSNSGCDAGFGGAALMLAAAALACSAKRARKQ